MDSEKSRTEILELVKLLKALILAGDLDGVQNILMEREKRLRIEFEFNRRELDLMKESVNLAEKAQKQAEDDKERYLNEFRISRKRKCKEVEEEVEKLRENERILKDRLSRAGGGCDVDRDVVKELKNRVNSLDLDKVAAENSVKEMKEKLDRAYKIVELQNRMISDASNTEKELRRRISELEETNKKIRAKESTDHRIIQDLKLSDIDAHNEKVQLNRRLSDFKIKVEEMNIREEEANKTVEDLKHKNLEAWQKVEELEFQKSRADEAVEMSKKRLESLRMKIEETSEVLKIKMDDLVNLAMSEENAKPCPGPDNVRIVGAANVVAGPSKTDSEERHARK